MLDYVAPDHETRVRFPPCPLIIFKDNNFYKITDIY